MELRQIDSILFKTLYLTVAGIAVTQILGMGDLTSILYLVTFPLTLALWMRSVRKTITGTDFLMLGTVMLALVGVLLDAGLSGIPLTFSYIKKLIMFVMTLMFLQTTHRMRADRSLVRFVNVVVDLLTVIFIIMYFLDNRDMHLIDGRMSSYLTFQFSNPNLTAMFLVNLYMLELYRLFTREKWYLKLIHIGMAVFLAWFILETRSRNVLLTLAAFTLVCAWLVFKSRRRLRITKTFAGLAAWSPAIFVAAYMVLVSSDWVQKLFEFLTGEGKKLISRVEIWQRALDHLKYSPLIGSYGGISDGTGMSQMHNTHLDIACSYGLVVMILVCVLLTRYLWQKGRYYDNKANYIYILGFACAIMLGIGEAALFSGGIGVHILIGTLLLLANRSDQAAEVLSVPEIPAAADAGDEV